MCEIAVVDPEQCPQNGIHQIAGKFEDEQGDGLGVLAVHRDADAETFSYNLYKSTEPHWATLHKFLQRNYDDAWRIVIHGRASTSGNINRKSSHPIRVDCSHDECSGEGSFEYVVHNGHVRNHSKIKGVLRRNGHDLNTKVDTEIIAHRVGTLPETVEDHHQRTYNFRGNLNYLLFSEDGILVRVSNKYHLTDDLRMACSLRDFDADELGFTYGNDTEWLLMTPDGESETKERTSWSNYEGNSSRGASRRSGSSSPAARRSAASDDPWRAGNTVEGEDIESVDDGVVQVYQDHSHFDHLSVIKVAPGVMKLIQHVDEKQEYIKRHEEPELYYFYAPEDPPEGVEVGDLSDIANEEPPNADQKTLDEVENSNHDDMNDACSVDNDVYDGQDSRDKSAASRVTMTEAAEIADDVEEKLQEGNEGN